MSTHHTSTHSRTNPSRNSTRRSPRNQGGSGPSGRLVLLVILAVVLFGLLSFRVVQLQVFGHASYAKISASQVSKKITTTALRAGIYDRNGQILAVSRPTALVIALSNRAPCSTSRSDVTNSKCASRQVDSFVVEKKWIRSLKQFARPHSRSKT